MDEVPLDAILTWAIAIGVGVAVAIVACLFVLSLFGINVGRDE